jgi:hypothetical protein
LSFCKPPDAKKQPGRSLELTPLPFSLFTPHSLKGITLQKSSPSSNENRYSRSKPPLNRNQCQQLKNNRIPRRHPGEGRDDNPKAAAGESLSSDILTSEDLH